MVTSKFVAGKNCAIYLDNGSRTYVLFSRASNKASHKIFPKIFSFTRMKRYKVLQTSCHLIFEHFRIPTPYSLAFLDEDLFDLIFCSGICPSLEGAQFHRSYKIWKILFFNEWNGCEKWRQNYEFCPQVVNFLNSYLWWIKFSWK